MTDIVERLRYGTQQHNHASLVGLCDEAAATIEHLRARLERIRVALASTDPEWTLNAIRRELEEKQ